MDRKVFFDALKPNLFRSYTQDQVGGIDSILSEAEKRQLPLNQLAYVLATSYHETAQTMQPITERGGKSYFSKYDAGTPIGRRLGNTQPGDGYLYRGRGFVQLTGRHNYQHASEKLAADFIADPDLVMEMDHAVAILFEGMEHGWFTGRSLDSYIDDKDESDSEDLAEFMKARMIINGTDKAETIGRYAISFEHALRASKYGEPATTSA